MANDALVRAFLHRAAAVVAANRGLTPECQLQLEQLAGQMKLDREEWQYCLNEVRDQATGEEEPNRYERAFMVEAATRLEKTAGRILSLGKEQSLLSIAREKYQLSQIRSHQLVELVCEQLDIRRISLTDSEASFRQLASELIGARKRVAPETVSQLIDAGRAWGLDEPDVKRIVAEIDQSNSGIRIRQIRRVTFITLLLVALAITSIVTTNRLLNPFKSETTSIEIDPESDHTKLSVHPWWSENIEIESTAPSLDGEARQILERLAVDPAELRQKAYQELGQWMVRNGLNDNSRVIQLLDQIDKSDPELKVWNEVIQTLSAELRSCSASLPIARTAMVRGISLAELFRLLTAEANETDLINSRIEALRQHPSNLPPGNETAGLLQSWWNLLVMDSELPNADCVMALTNLRESSQGILDAELVFRWHSQAVRLILAKPGIRDLNGAGSEMAIAVAATERSDLPAWIRLWNKLPDPGLKQQLADLIIRAANSKTESIGRTEVPAAMNGLMEQLLYESEPQLASLTNTADRSLELARAMNEQVGQYPANIALTAQAVNDGLAVMVELDDLAAGVRSAKHLNSMPRFDSLVKPDRSAEAPANEALATAADFRTLEVALAEISLFETQPERAGFRIQLVEELLRIAPRIENLSGDDSRTLARYFLHPMLLEEWLAAEKSLPGFRFWPSFVLAVADLLPDSQVPLDQAISIVQLLGNQHFQLHDAKNWRLACQNSLIQNTLRQLESQVGRQQGEIASKWKSVEYGLSLVFQSRRLLLGDSLPIVSNGSTADVEAIRIMEFQLGLTGFAPDHLLKQPSTGPTGGMAIAVAADLAFARSLGSKIANELKDLASKQEFRIAMEKLNGPMIETDLGHQLWQIEKELLSLITQARTEKLRTFTLVQ